MKTQIKITALLFALLSGAQASHAFTKVTMELESTDFSVSELPDGYEGSGRFDQLYADGYIRLVYDLYLPDEISLFGDDFWVFGVPFEKNEYGYEYFDAIEWLEFFNRDGEKFGETYSVYGELIKTGSNLWGDLGSGPTTFEAGFSLNLETGVGDFWVDEVHVYPTDPSQFGVGEWEYDSSLERTQSMDGKASILSLVFEKLEFVDKTKVNDSVGTLAMLGLGLLGLGALRRRV